VAPTPAPTIRIIDEAAVQEHQQQQAWAHQQQVAAMAAQAAQLEGAMRMAAGNARPAAAAPMDAAGPLFVSPRAEQPQQRTLFAATAPAVVEEEFEEEEVASGRNIFGRLANVGKAIAGSGSREVRAVREAVSPAPAIERKAEVRETTPTAADDEEFYDIPAFLRRQAN